MLIFLYLLIINCIRDFLIVIIAIYHIIISIISLLSSTIINMRRCYIFLNKGITSDISSLTSWSGDVGSSWFGVVRPWSGRVQMYRIHLLHIFIVDIISIAIIIIYVIIYDVIIGHDDIICWALLHKLLMLWWQQCRCRLLCRLRVTNLS